MLRAFNIMYCRVDMVPPITDIVILFIADHIYIRISSYKLRICQFGSKIERRGCDDMWFMDDAKWGS